LKAIEKATSSPSLHLPHLVSPELLHSLSIVVLLLPTPSSSTSSPSPFSNKYHCEETECVSEERALQERGEDQVGRDSLVGGDGGEKEEERVEGFDPQGVNISLGMGMKQGKQRTV
jgi:hypothetical protein